MTHLFLKGLFSVAIFTVVVGWGVNGVSAATFDIDIKASGPAGAFSPSSLTITTGDTVRWTSLGDGHQIASDKHPIHDEYPDPVCPNAGCLDSPLLFTNDTYSFTFLIGGTWDYHNHQLPGRTGIIIVADANTPAAITDLAASNPAQSSIDLTWTSPGDDVGNTGNFLTPTSYDIRHSTAGEIDEAAWAAATSVADTPTIQAAGSTDSVTVTGLSPNTTYYFAIKASDEVPNESAISNSSNFTTLALGQSGGGISDFEPPSDITDLSVKVLTKDSVELSWTAPGDDFDEGTAALYDVRYTTQILTASTFSFATQVKAEPAPKEAGTTETLTISGLISLETYSFVIRAFDEFLNETKNSNIVTLTIIPPDIITPSAVTDIIFTLPSPTSVDLAWTSPGDDGDVGTVAHYDIRHLGEMITEENWDMAEQFIDKPEPTEGGSFASLLISGFDHDLTYYIAFKAIDDVGNESPISNVITFTTPPVPEAALPPKSEPTPLLPLSALSDGTLIRATGDSKVYVMRDGKQFWIPTQDAFIAGGYDWDRVQEIDAADIESTRTLNLFRIGDHPEVYVLYGDKRRHIPTPEAFVTEGYTWDNISILSGEEASWHPEATLLRGQDDDKVFFIEGGTKQWIETEEEFLSLGHEWGSIVEVTSVELEHYPDASLEDIII